MRGRSLLAVFAHPDDESLACGGLLAWCADLGARVSLVCLTRGEHGGAPDAPVDPALGAVRLAELQAAAQTLRLSTVTVLDHEDGMLPWVDADRLKEDIAEAIAQCRPDVVVTFGEDGLYWHPDHIAVHERTTAAVAALGAEAPALYYVTMPPGAMRALVEASSQAEAHVLGIENADAFGAQAAPPTLVVDVGAYAARKLAALQCHRTQVRGGAIARLDEGDARRLLGIEHYRRADVGSRAEAFIEWLGTGWRDRAGG